jgi:hypothetical protein
MNMLGDLSRVLVEEVTELNSVHAVLKYGCYGGKVADETDML